VCPNKPFTRLDKKKKTFLLFFLFFFSNGSCGRFRNFPENHKKLCYTEGIWWRHVWVAWGGECERATADAMDTTAACELNISSGACAYAAMFGSPPRKQRLQLQGDCGDSAAPAPARTIRVKFMQRARPSAQPQPKPCKFSGVGLAV
jgi:hypothetical protein